MKIYNGTGETIRLVNRGQETLVIPENDPLRVEAEEFECPWEVERLCPDHPVWPHLFGRKKFFDPAPLPPGYDLYLVSEEYYRAAEVEGRDTTKLAVPADPQYDNKGNLLGYTKLRVG